jgi:hypothetical protein
MKAVAYTRYSSDSQQIPRRLVVVLVYSDDEYTPKVRKM